ncbi:nuclear transport factor 2 family protein [Panacibacter sp. DH6]|uniref:Nuclear transport factor 2 family protein n=1 Tax=Panacibacter microcysteis TaxID=2793269 RepID=A0A931E786_9BACT|nr:nuclear transport factor 2 family protein [Panacibacter microcysteis]MBG9376565.1 nuclear transport factor 2 family protein [Panacibacter microcysteis]
MHDLQKRDPQQLEKWFTPESVVWIPPANPVKGKNKILVLFRAIFSRYKELNWQIEKIFEVADNQCVYFSSSWGAFRNGSNYKNRIVTEILFNEKGEITNLSDYFKDTLFSNS